MTMRWRDNITEREPGKFRTENGTANEMIAVGRIIKAGFPCTLNNVPNSKYDAVADVGGKLLRIQIKGFKNEGKSPRISLTGGSRSGQQISRTAKSREYSYTKEDCDILVAIDSGNGDCWIFPVEDLEKWGSSVNVSKVTAHRENWSFFTRELPETELERPVESSPFFGSE